MSWIAQRLEMFSETGPAATRFYLMVVDNALKPDEPKLVKLVQAVLAADALTIDLDVVIAASMSYGVNVEQEAALELCIVAILRRLFTIHMPASVLRTLEWEETRQCDAVFNELQRADEAACALLNNNY